MPAPLLTLPELEEALGHQLPGALATQAERYLELVSAEVRHIARPHLDEVEPPDVPPLIQLVTTQIMRRVLANPLGLSGSAVDGYQWQASGQTGPFVSRDERERIRSAVGKSAFSAVEMTSYLPVYPSSGSVGLASARTALDYDIEE